jgi:hypothetical protein
MIDPLRWHSLALINSMEWSSWDTENRSVDREIPWFLWNLKVNYYVHYPAVGLYSYPVESSPSYFYKINFNIFLPSIHVIHLRLFVDEQ